MRAIGGYFEIADYENGKSFPHSGGILLNTGRNALEYILRHLSPVKRVYLPFYTCGVVLEPLKKLQIPWRFYHVDTNFEMVEDIQPGEGEYVIVNNYFGIKDDYLRIAAQKYADHLIADCAQALFGGPAEGVKSFYSFRKYVGVADGGVAYLGREKGRQVEVDDIECTEEHDGHIYTRKHSGAEAGFAEYQTNECKLENQPVRWMSETTRRILEHIDYDKVIAVRRDNFSYLHDALNRRNLLQLPGSDTFVCPMVYPFLTKNGGELRRKMIENRVYVAKYWPDMQRISGFGTEFGMADSVIAVPCDHRYGKDDMDRIIQIINND